MKLGQLETELRESPHCSVLTDGDDPCFRVGAHFCYPRRKRKREHEVPAASSPQYIERYGMTYPVEVIRALARGELTDYRDFNAALEEARKP